MYSQITVVKCHGFDRLFEPIVSTLRVEHGCLLSQNHFGFFIDDFETCLDVPVQFSQQLIWE
jgi:hypothetical protein